MLLRRSTTLATKFTSLCITARHFPRAVMPKLQSLDELKDKSQNLLEERQKFQEQEERKEYFLKDKEEQRARRMQREEREEEDLYDHHFEDYSCARLSLGVMLIPEQIQKRAKKVFSKFNAGEVREWAYQLNKHYQSLHACEKPLDLNVLIGKPKFMNTIDMKTHIQELKDQAQDTGRLAGITKQILKKEGDLDQDVYKLEQKSGESRMEGIVKDSPEVVKLKYERAHAIGYLLKKMPQTYGVNTRIFHEIKQRFPEFKPTSLLDYGAGLGSAAWAGIDQYSSLKKVAAVEPNPNMRKLGRFLTSELETEILWTEALSMIPGTGSQKGKFEVVTLSHVLQEIATPRARTLVLQTLWSRVKESGIMIVVEPGSPKGFRYMHDVRSWFIQSYTREQASIAGPCPHHLECPMAAQPRKWCHFSQLITRYKKEVFPIRKFTRQFENQKFTYLILKKGPTPNVLFEAEREAPTPEQKSFFWPRVILPVIRKHKHSIIDVCSNNGRLERLIIAKSHGAFGGYRSAKRTKWGDLWHVGKRIPNRFRKEKKRGKRLW